MSDQNQAKVKAKGTPKTESIIGAASNKMVTATKALTDAVAQAVKLTDTVNENALKIADQEDKLQGLNTEFQNRRTQHKIDLDLAYKADQAGFAQKYLTENKLTAVPATEYDQLKNSVTEWEQKFEEKVEAEVGKARGIAQSKAESDRRVTEAEYKAKEAQNLATIDSLKQQLQFANEQVASWKGQLDAERNASIERSKSNSAVVNVSGQNGR
jgi:hypothetical protein